MAKTFKNFIAGAWVAPSTGAYYENRNPADWRDLIGRFPSSGKRDVERAVRSAWRGFEEWRRVPVPQRGDVMRRVGDLLVKASAGEDAVVGHADFLDLLQVEEALAVLERVKRHDAGEGILRFFIAHGWSAGG